MLWEKIFQVDGKSGVMSEVTIQQKRREIIDRVLFWKFHLANLDRILDNFKGGDRKLVGPKSGRIFEGEVCGAQDSGKMSANTQ